MLDPAIEFGRLDPDPDLNGRKWPTKKKIVLF
jgi:hypothetical protein